MLANKLVAKQLGFLTKSFLFQSQRRLFARRFNHFNQIMRQNKLFYGIQRMQFSGMTKVEGEGVEQQQQDPQEPLSYTFDADSLKGNRNHKTGLMMIMFTCGVCNNRQGRTFSKDAYEKGVVLIRCEGCDNLHLIADNLNWFREEKVNIEKLMEEKGKKIYKFVSNESLEFLMGDNKPEGFDEQRLNFKHEHQHGHGCCGGHHHDHDHGHDHEHGHCHSNNEHKHEGGCCGGKQKEQKQGCCGGAHNHNHDHHQKN